MKNTNPKVDFYFEKADKWHKEIEILRSIVLRCGLQEELKWGVPCYTHQNRNIVLIHTFKAYAALLFFKGSLLQDVDSILIQQTKQVQAARQIRFTNIQEIKKLEEILKNYIYEAVSIEEAGLKVELKKTAAYCIPEEFEEALKRQAKLKKAFEALTPGRQRGYLLYFAAAKQSKTRTARIEKYTGQILNGKGLND